MSSTKSKSIDERRTRLLELQERLSPAFVSEPLTELLHRYTAPLPVSLELLDPAPPDARDGGTDAGRGVRVRGNGTY